MKTILKAAATVSVLAVGLAGCAGELVPSDASGEGSVTRTEPESKNEELSMQSGNELNRRLEARQGNNNRMPERISRDAQTHVIGEVPESMLQIIKEDLAKRINIAVSDAQVVKAEALTWSDGALGCPKPGENYTQALVPGYWVILEHADKQYDYRASERGYFFLCQMPTHLRLPEDSR